MRFRFWTTIQVYLFIYLTMVLVLLAAMTVPVLAAQAMSQDLKMTIMNRIPVAGERGKVLQSTARAVEGGYPEDRLSPVIEKSLDSGISGDALSRMIEILDDAHRNGLPTQPYAEKIMEGLAKRIKEDRILVALDRVGKRIKFASVQAERVDGAESSSRILVIRTSDAVAAGMDMEIIERIYDVMAQGRVNRKIEPEDIMEMVKAASGYGVESESVGNYAISLMKSRKADLDDIRHYLEELSEIVYRINSGKDSGNNIQMQSENIDHDDDSDEDTEDDESTDENGGDSEDGGDGGDGEDSEDGEDEPEHD